MKNLNTLNKYRIHIMDDIGDETCGAFSIPYKSYRFKVVASCGLGWEHVSISLENRCPNWGEMCYFKDLFFEDEECVMQLHPPKSNYVNNHKYCLHLWRPLETTIPMPSSLLVGIKEMGCL